MAGETQEFPRREYLEIQLKKPSPCTVCTAQKPIAFQVLCKL
jgi:hypothetical protein